ncbi:MAG: UDP-N-acetylmuramoyl-L-alanyl-D-glutamate--2,6-diaminopimelate ligase [Actinobacteria bacterium]|nr:UDP-N-acetylmuramoyl-L-alanyl-D-glutamate--2,6-diaminopimelate ligase [Actinomycetota bacterium]MCL5887299.1 UDP-N-acetylmuramoyl-L-alanyl-D-glutamate--2,6-diaminopimelate ligase [Actinomycetota bacterium]
MPLFDLMSLLSAAEVLAGEAVQVEGLAYDSRKVGPKDAFFCIPGLQSDGHDFAREAVSRGAAALVVTRRLAEFAHVPQILVADARKALAVAAAVFYGSPSRGLSIVGVTGTNGKTTTTYLVDSILRHSGLATGLIGTVETRIRENAIPAERTTPESLDLQRLLAQMSAEGVEAVAMEVSSHAIDLGRVDAVSFAVAAFTNLTQDHLDYHGSMEAYGAVKLRLFTELEVAKRVINIDDPVGVSFAAAVDDPLTVGTSADAVIRATEVELMPDASRFVLSTPSGQATVTLPIAGAYNVSNALVAAGCAYALGIPLADIAAGLAHATQVPGRLERVSAGQPFSVFVDYAHTPDSLRQVLEAIKRVTPGRVIAVFGCGGDRDPAKRPLMGEAASAVADHAIITSDNPRTEDPNAIIAQILPGMSVGGATYQVEVDRRRAIASALATAGPNDSVLIAGKGHEDYQIFADKTVHFDDREVAFEELSARC